MSQKKRSQLAKDVELAEEETRKHPLPEIRRTYIVNPAKLSNEETESLEAHLRGCQRCREEINDIKSRADFFRRQKPICD